jgi:hypothetical protein
MVGTTGYPFSCQVTASWTGQLACSKFGGPGLFVI